jgi:hypothetical protein
VNTEKQLNLVKQLTEAQSRGAKKVRFEDDGKLNFHPILGESESISDAIARIHAGAPKLKSDADEGGKPAAAPAAAETVLPFPKEKSQLKKGAVYQTSRGPATWDGAQFVK